MNVATVQAVLSETTRFIDLGANSTGAFTAGIW